MTIKKKSKKKSNQIPIMKQKDLIRETNHLVWEIRHELQKIRDDDTIVKLWNMMADLYAYADDLRIDAYRFVKYPGKVHENQLIKRIGEIEKFHQRLEYLEKMKRVDQQPPQEVRETNKNLN